jgi:hypothetical protein
MRMAQKQPSTANGKCGSRKIDRNLWIVRLLRKLL